MNIFSVLSLLATIAQKKGGTNRPSWLFPILNGVVLTAITLTGCGPSEQDDLVARVGTYPITSSALRSFVAELPDGLRVQETGDVARRHYLQDMIDRRLMLLEAQSRGLDTTQAVRAAVGKELDSRARSLYRARKMAYTEQLDPEEGRRYFATEGYNRERKLTAILLESKAQINAALADLKAGKAFEDIARTRSLDKAAAAQGGALGWIGRSMAAQLYIPLETFLNLPTGQVSEPLPAGKSWHLVRFTEERPATYEKYRLLISSRLHADYTTQRAEEHFEHLEASFTIGLNTDGLNELVAAYHQRTPEVLADSPTPLYRYDQGEVTVGQVYRRLEPLKESRALAAGDGSEAITILRKYVLRPFLLEEAARRAGIYDEPDLKRFSAEYQEDIVLATMREFTISRKIILSEAEVRQYYDEHLEFFFHKGSTWIEELLLPTEAAAQELKKQLEAGVRFEEFASLSLRSGAVKSKAQFHFHPLEKVRYPRLLPAILAAPPGQLVGPLELQSGFSVFRLLKQEEGAVESFASAGRRAKGLLRRQREKVMFRDMITALREQYADQTEIFAAQLHAALPDSLVGVE